MNFIKLLILSLVLIFLSDINAMNNNNNNNNNDNIIIAADASMNFFDQQLFQGACSGNLEQIFNALDHGTSINTRDNEGWTALHRALEQKQFKVVKALLLRGANVTAKTNTGLTPLHTAAQWGKNKVVKEILKYIHDETLLNDRGYPLPLYNNEDIVIQELRRESQRVNFQITNNKSSISKTVCAIAGHKKFIKGSGWTPLCWAVYYHHYKSAKALLEHGADSEIESDDGLSLSNIFDLKWKFRTVKDMALQKLLFEYKLKTGINSIKQTN